MATLDFTPLFRSTIGFDTLPSLLSAALERDELGYPPYNIEKLGEDTYRIVMAVSGFGQDDVEIVQKHNRLTVKGHAKESDGKSYLYRGIAARAFSRDFDLADHVDVVEAVIDHGLLSIVLRRELPEALKPRVIKIGSSETKTLTDQSHDGQRAA
jgi:molecular chaperone IbpA